MKRKLIDFDVFKQIEKGSLSNAEYELLEAEDILAEALNIDSISLHCFGENNVTYTTPDGTFVYASYKLDENALILENIEELVIDESQEKQNATKILSTMVEELIEGHENKAHDLFNEYIELGINKRLFSETRTNKRLVPIRKKIGNKWKVVKYEPGKAKKHGKSQPASVVAKRAKAKKLGAKKMSLSEKKRRKALRSQAHKRYGFMKEASAAKIANITENVLEYVNYVELGPVLKETVARFDENQNIVSLRIPTTKVRNEGKILSFNWKTMNTELKVCRDAGKNLAENIDFCKDVGNLKRQNAFNNADAFQEALEALVVKYPDVVYVTEQELANIVKEALNTVGIINYDDEICQFMAEGLLRTAHNIHSDRVDRVLKLADCTSCKEYDCFQEAVSKFYVKIDETTTLEMQVFYDLYTVVGEIYRTAVKSGDEVIAGEAQAYAKDLSAICEGQLEPDIELAEEVADWAYELVEANLSGAGEWNPSNSTHHTIVGDHPNMSKLAHVDGIPSKYSGDWPDSAPVSDGKSYHNNLADKMRNRSWSNVGGPDTYPSLQNPYVPKPFGDYTMKGETGVDKNSDTGLTQVQGDTWPSLQNPYVPKAETPESYKMNKGKEADLVVEK